MVDLISTDEQWGNVRGKLNGVGQDVAAVRAYGAGSGGSSALNYAAFTDLFGIPTGGGKVFLDRDTYDIGASTLLFNLSGAWIKGVRGGSLLTTSAKVLLNMGSVSDCVFEDIHFVSTAVSSAEDTVNAVVRFIHRAARRHKFINCTFSILNANANAIKAVADTGSEITESIHFYDCHILGAGRMGVELSNHPTTIGQPSDTVSRHFDWVWAGGSIKNTGLVSPDYGMGFSVTGFAEDVRIDTRLDNNMTCGVEFVGACNSRVSGRLTNMRDVSGSTPSAPISFTTNSLVDASRKMTDNIVDGFQADDGTGREIRFWNQERLITRGNLFKLSAGSTGRGYVTYVGSKNCKSIGDRYDCDGNYALQGRSDLNQGGGTSNCIWTDLSIDHSRAPSAFYEINFVGKGTENNTVIDLLHAPKTTSEPLISSQSEATLTASFSGSTMTVTAQSGTSLYVGQEIFGDSVQGLTVITALGTGSGGTGTYTVTPTQTAASSNCTAGRAKGNFMRGMVRSTSGYDLVSNAYNMAGDFNVDVNLLDNAPNLLASRNLNITSAVALTATRSLLFPAGFPSQRVTNNTTGGQSIQIRDKFGGTAVTIANGATVTVASTSSGYVAIP